MILSLLYGSQVSTKTTVVNFSVKQLGLEAQLLGIVVQREQPSLEDQSSELTVKVCLALARFLLSCNLFKVTSFP